MNLTRPSNATSLTVLAVAGTLLAAVAHAQTQNVSTELVAQGLQNPWGLAFIGEGRMLVTERPGRMRVIGADGRVGEPLKGVPAVDAVGQGGLLDVVTDRDFARNRTLHFCYAEPGMGGNSTAMASARLSADATALDNVQVVFTQKPKVASRLHFGCRIVQAEDGSLFLALGDRFQRMADAQTLDNHHGKVVRVRADGSAHPDNPFVGRAGALPEIWSLGHRNVQGATLGPDGRLWTIEHGPQGGDELNRTDAGKNYGWPVITYGENYGGGKVGEGLTRKAGLEQPLLHWTPSIAPSGMAFVKSARYGADWQGNLLVGSLKFRYLARLVMDGERVVREDKLLPNLGQRIRDVRQGPDGFIYLLTDDRDGQLLRLKPGP
ncbi:MAG: PQQ-dependent sugar dehydrogenase [Hydrogenophaga sp.]|jgi:glucose/arabinose dehydrogenase|uniref:PQQ-dependent sugar dehydrogenase n=1 Tax=Hydrogenophaga sp. TaxID=1904254 RepID=UPI001D37B1B3|nr:PQQ-dependent sugar dehydrogenase [Hydrogenophaga sp.]MBW0170434.1 PQQ-dependent sugar dehydrogenase [Hydrogenophaga sp.]MBW0184893.1 PQQ-dependent sugar dehydrogenase [Hydrogenophaga sp.]